MVAYHGPVLFRQDSTLISACKLANIFKSGKNLNAKLNALFNKVRSLARQVQDAVAGLLDGEYTASVALA